MGEIYKWLGLEVGLVVPGIDRSYKKLQYDADVPMALTTN